MSLLVQKYGGTSVGCVERIGAVADKIARFRRAGYDVVAVVSAIGGETDRLSVLAAGVSEQPPPRELDALLATGEQVSTALLSMALQKRGCPARSYTGGQAAIRTDGCHTRARIRTIDTAAIKAAIERDEVAVVAGFQGVDAGGDITTLGRGGSDTTAVALAAALQADECQIYTDVKGVYTTDPRVVDGARLLKTVTFEEMLELASLGAKVLQLRAVEFAGKYKVPLRVLSSFEEGEGTLITLEEELKVEDPTIAGVAFERDEAKLTVTGVPDVPGIAYKVIGPVGEAGIEVDVIVQNAGADGANDITFTVKRSEASRAQAILEGVKGSLPGREVVLDTKICKVSLVGVGMRSHAGIASRMFKALADEGINIQIITTSEVKISVVIEEKYLELAVRALHSAFDLGRGGSLPP